MPVKKVEINSRMIWAAALGMAVIAFSLWYTAAPKSDSGNVKRETAADVVLQQAELEAQHALTSDKDNDGLKDWEELLAGTDPNKADTDGDGTPDAEEVRKLADPAPDSAGQAPLPNNSEQGEEEDEESNLTDAVTRRIFAAYMQSKQSDLYHPASMARVVTEVAGSAFGNVENERVYNSDDLKAVVEPTGENVKYYYSAANKATSLIKNIKEYELTTYARGVENEDEEEFAKLMNSANVYRAAAKNLLVVPVPQDITNEHVKLVNAFLSFADTLEEMSKMVDDPVLSFVHVRDFLQQEQKINDIYAKLSVYFEK